MGRDEIGMRSCSEQESERQKEILDGKESQKGRKETEKGQVTLDPAEFVSKDAPPRGVFLLGSLRLVGVCLCVNTNIQLKQRLIAE